MGNRFDGVLRDTDLNLCGTTEGKATLDSRFQRVAKHGFANYFGLQRFGSQRIRSFHVGAAILSKRFDDAVRLLLGDGSSLGQEQYTSPSLAADDISESTIRESQRIFLE